jgi:hypothetical protein
MLERKKVNNINIINIPSIAQKVSQGVVKLQTLWPAKVVINGSTYNAILGAEYVEQKLDSRGNFRNILNLPFSILKSDIQEAALIIGTDIQFPTRTDTSRTKQQKSWQLTSYSINATTFDITATCGD